MDATSRIRWLDLQNHPERDFWPQPWEQCAKVLREMGHAEDARRVLIAKEERQRRARRLRYVHQGRRGKALVIGVSADILWLTVAYGRRPLRAFAWLLGLWILGAWVFHTAAHNDAIKPNNAFVLRSPEWAACAPGYTPAPGGPAPRHDVAQPASQLSCFMAQPEARSYPTFNAWVYSADTLLPIVAMEMQEYWIPNEHAGPWGAVARVYLWIQIAMGWALSLLAVAGFSGLVKQDST